MNKYIVAKDSELVLLSKDGNEEARMELFDRYRYQIRSLVGKLYHQYQKTTYATFEDLLSVGQTSLLIAIDKYSDSKIPFNSYWRKIATHNIIDCLEECKSVPYEFDPQNNDDAYVIGSTDLTRFLTIENEIASFLNNPKNDISPLERKLFFSYLEGYSITELAMEHKLAYNTVKRKIDYVRSKIRHILFNS